MPLHQLQEAVNPPASSHCKVPSILAFAVQFSPDYLLALPNLACFSLL